MRASLIQPLPSRFMRSLSTGRNSKKLESCLGLLNSWIPVGASTSIRLDASNVFLACTAKEYVSWLSLSSPCTTSSAILEFTAFKTLFMVRSVIRLLRRFSRRSNLSALLVALVLERILISCLYLFQSVRREWTSGRDPKRPKKAPANPSALVLVSLINRNSRTRSWTFPLREL